MKTAIVLLLAITVAFSSTAWGQVVTPAASTAATSDIASSAATTTSSEIDPFPDPASCPRFQKELQFLKNNFVEGQTQGRVWQTAADRHTDSGDRLQVVAGESAQKPWVQVGVVAGTAVIGVRTVASAVSKPVLVVVLLLAGAAAYLGWHRAVDYRQNLEKMREVEIQHIDYFDLVKANQNYERNFIWPEQVERFKRIVQLNDKDMGLPTYKGGYQAFPVQDLLTVLQQQFSYFKLQHQLFYKAYMQLEDLPQETNWYVRMTTERHADLVKARMADSLYQTYAYQAQLAYATGIALDQACTNAPLTGELPRP